MITFRRRLPLVALAVLAWPRLGGAQSGPASIAEVAPPIDAAERTIDAVPVADGNRADGAALAARVADLQPADQTSYDKGEEFV